MHIEFTENPLYKDILYITEKINTAVPGYGSVDPFAFYIKDNDKIIAGCNGHTIFGEIYTDLLWVDENQRNKGLGKKLMQAVFKHGLSKNCTIATLTTMSFQNAQKFYTKIGFIKQYEHFGYIKNSSKIFYSKTIV